VYPESENGDDTVSTQAVEDPDAVRLELEAT
jgi:hypothetical protein